MPTGQALIFHYFITSSDMVQLSGDTNDTACRSGTSIAGLLGLFVSSPAKIISSRMNDDGTANNALGANQLDELVGGGTLAIALAISLEVAQVTYMANLILRSTMCLAMGVEVGTSRCAPVCIVTELMDVHATLGIRVVASDIPRDSGWGRLGLLLEGNGAGDLRVTSDGCDCSDHFDKIWIGYLMVW